MRIRAVALTMLTAAALLVAAIGEARPRALLIGVADVPNNELPGIDLDIDNMKKVAEVMGFAPGDIKVLFNQQATYANVREALATWVRSGVAPDDHVLIYFSGHGTRVPDPANLSGVDDALVLHDVERARLEGRATLRNVLIGHEFGAALAAITSRNVRVLVDACHSGTATRGIRLGNQRLGVGSGVEKFFSYDGMPKETPGRTRALRVASGSENYAALSAARDDEFAVGTEQGGLFTLGVVGAIEEASRLDLRVPEAKRRLPKSRFDAFALEPEVIINNQWSTHYTVIEISGLDAIKDKHVSWAKEALRPGSEVTIRILPAGKFDPPRSDDDDA